MTTKTETSGSKLALALSKAQGKMKSAKKDTDNTFFKSKYADLASVWDACRDALAENELAIIQVPEMQNGVIGIRSKLYHSSGEYEEGFFPLAVAATARAQEMGSAMTYLRRYALSAMVGVAPEEDDGNAAQTAQTQNVPPLVAKITDEQVKTLDEWIDTTSSSKPKLLTAYNVKSLSDMDAKQYAHALKTLQKKADTKLEPEYQPTMIDAG